MCDIPNGTLKIYRSDFDGRIDIIPVSDPNIPSSAHRMMMAQLALQLAQSSPPGMFDIEELNKTILNAANIPNLDKIMPSKPKPVPLDPVSDIAASVKGMPIKAFPGQNHDAHIQVKTMYLQDPANGANPLMQRIAPILEANMQEHLMLKYQEQITGITENIVTAYGDQAEQQGINPNDPQVIEAVMATAAQQVMQANQIAAMQQQAMSPEAQLVQIEGQKLGIEQQKIQAQAAKEAVNAANKERELDLKELQIQLDMFKEGANITAKAEDSERDRESKKAIAAMEALLELADTEANIDRDKTLKAADMLSKFVSERNKG
jgi:hypothetical protein